MHSTSSKMRRDNNNKVLAYVYGYDGGAMKHETNDRVSIMNFTYCRCR